VYQLSASVLPGLTIVVSPLLALMKDQVEGLRAQGVEVSVINSTLGSRAVAGEMKKIQEGSSRLLYVTPERFDNDQFLADLHGVPLSLFVVDEAHCVSEWGHSFRPSYLALGGVAKMLGRPPLLALTATATPWIRNEIVEQLGMRDPIVVVHGTDRPNLFFEVRRVEEEYDDRRILELLLMESGGRYAEDITSRLQTAMQGNGIIYTATTKAARETAEWLRSWGIAADYYHGQRKKVDRERVQDAFMSGELRVIVATNAFGLGVDKPDVRFVIHRDVPSSLEAYYQEAGRAGRDGQFARCTLIYRPGDLGRAAFLSGSGQLTVEEVAQGWHALLEHPTVAVTDLEEVTGLGKADVRRLVRALQRAGALIERGGRIRLRRMDLDLSQLSLDDEADRQAYEQSRIDMMRAYAEAGSCRREFILNYFGERPIDPVCAQCDNDLTAAVARVVIREEYTVDSSFQLGQQVVHEAWGPGVVQRVTGDTITVLFEHAGYKQLATELVEEQRLLRPA
jgi:ATP-dependent DNA helicase RecQ